MPKLVKTQLQFQMWKFSDVSIAYLLNLTNLYAEFCLEKSGISFCCSCHFVFVLNSLYIVKNGTVVEI